MGSVGRAWLPVQRDMSPGTPAFPASHVDLLDAPSPALLTTEMPDGTPSRQRRGAGRQPEEPTEGEAGAWLQHR